MQRDFEKLFTDEEALELSKYTITADDLYISADLWQSYIKNHEFSNDTRWEQIKMLSFLYCTGKLQGIREERLHRKRLFA